MEDLKNVYISPLPDSPYVKPFRFNYTQNGKEKTWDLLEVHDSVAIVVFNVSRKVMIFVKQFRPAIYYNCIHPDDRESKVIDTEKYPASLGIALEMCAGIIDKNKPVEHIAQEEVLEECGYNVPLNQLHKITSYRHIQEKHSIKEGTIILCQYGQNGICSALQFGDLRKAGFKYHVRQHHVYKTNTNDDWTFYSSSQNLPAVLNDPNRGKQSNFFTKTWGDGFIDKVEIYPSPYLPEITLLHFESYCKKISRRYRRHCQLKENLPSKTKTPVVENVCEVPNIFFEQSLALNDPKIFCKVFPGLSNTQDINSTIRSLQETLSTYLDVVEMKISKQVAQKSDVSQKDNIL